MRTLRGALLAVVVALILTACSGPAEPTAASASPSPTSSPSNSPSPAVTVALVLSLREVAGLDASGARTGSADLADGAAVEVLLTKALNAPVSRAHNDTVARVAIKWDGVVLGISDTTGQASVHFSASASGPVGLHSTEGVVVGMSKEQALAAGLSPSASFTDPSNGAVHELLISERESVPGTSSLVTPGSAGSEFVGHESVDGVVIDIYAPANDYSDL